MHIDQEFEFLIPQELSSKIKNGSLVKVPFNRKRVLGVVVKREERASFHGQLRYISEVVRDFPVLTPEIMSLASEITRYYGGNRWDALRFAIPTFSKVGIGQLSIHNEPSFVEQWQQPDLSEGPARNYPEGFWRALTQSPTVSSRVRALWCAPPAENPLIFLATIAENSRGNTLVVLPDVTDVRRFIELLVERNRVSMEHIVEWSSELSRQERERSFIRTLKGHARIIVGVRGALLLPLQELHTIVLWDEANEAFEERRAPYFHAREVAIMRSHLSHCHLVIGATAPSIEAAAYIQSGHLVPLLPNQVYVRERLPRVLAISNENAPNQRGLIPTIAWEMIKSGLDLGSVLVQVPQRGYIPALSCKKCRNLALCDCGGRLMRQQGMDLPTCSLCGLGTARWFCRFCGCQDFRHRQIGDERIAQMLGKAFPRNAILSVNADHRISRIDERARIVVCTPGSEPITPNGYQAALVLNSSITLERASLRAEENSRRNWFGLATLLAPSAPIFVDTMATNRNIHALVRWDPLSIAKSELEERSALNLPPAVKAIEVAGNPSAVAEVIRDLPEKFLVSHPKQIGEESIALLRFTGENRSHGVTEIFRRVRQQSARGAIIARIKVDPTSL